MKVYASVVDTKGKKQTFLLREKPILIGRSKTAHVTITDDLSSGSHCMISYQDGCVYVEDLKSKNGIYLNGIKIFKQRIYAEDKVKIGNTYLYIETKKMDDASIKAVTCEATSARNKGELTLEVETYNERKKNSLKHRSASGGIDNKLYGGVAENKKKLKKAIPTGAKLYFLEFTSFILDALLALVIGFSPILIFKFLLEEKFNEIFPKGALNSTTLTTGNGLYFSIGCLVFALIIFKWNRSRKKGSFGERICGLE